MDVIHWLQSFASPASDAFWRFFTTLGTEDVLLLVGAVLFWCVDAWRGWLFANTVIASVALNEWLKALSNRPRPDPTQVRVVFEDTVSGSSFPSGHAQHSVVIWGYVAALARRPVAWAAAIVVMLLVGASRMYAGLHFPVDVLAGYAVGALLLGVTLWITRGWTPDTPPELSIIVRLAFVIVPVVVFAVFPGNDVTEAAGAALGINIGFLWLLPRFGGAFPVRVGLGAQALKLIVGFGVVLALRLALKAVLPETDLADFLRYTIIGLWTGWLAPLAFRRLVPMPRASEPVPSATAGS